MKGLVIAIRQEDKITFKNIEKEEKMTAFSGKSTFQIITIRIYRGI
jgi:hypothetical protein